MLKCPSCRKPVPPREENAAYPFCSERCRAVDLGRWFTGAYRVAGRPAPEEAERARDAADRDASDA